MNTATVGTAAVLEAGPVEYAACQRLDAAPYSGPMARRWVQDILCKLRIEKSDREDAELIFSELVCNAITASAALGRANRYAIILYVFVLADGTVRLAVEDSNPTFPVRKAADEDAIGGRGLDIIGNLALRWGVLLTQRPGKMVAADLRLPEPPKFPRRIRAEIPARRWVPPDGVDVPVLKRVIAGLRRLPARVPA